MYDWSMCDQVTLPKFNMAQKLRSLFIPVERTLTVAYELQNTNTAFFEWPGLLIILFQLFLYMGFVSRHARVGFGLV